MKLENYIIARKLKGKQILALDYGEKVIGLASYRPGMDPFPLKQGRIINKGQQNSLKECLAIIEELVVDMIVCGLPLRGDGTDSEQTKIVRKFAQELKDNSALPLFFQDEYLSTKEAENRMQNSPEYNFQIDLTKIDELSAVIILEEFIQSDKDVNFIF